MQVRRDGKGNNPKVIYKEVPASELVKKKLEQAFFILFEEVLKNAKRAKLEVGDENTNE